MLIRINGMRCNNCKKSVEEAIKNVKGVKKYNVSLEDGTSGYHSLTTTVWQRNSGASFKW